MQEHAAKGTPILSLDRTIGSANVDQYSTLVDVTEHSEDVEVDNSDNTKVLQFVDVSGNLCNNGNGEGRQDNSSSNNSNLANLKKALSTYKSGIGIVSVADQSLAENIFMQDSSIVGDLEAMKPLNGGFKQMESYLQQPMTRAKAKHLAGGHQTSSLSQ